MKQIFKQKYLVTNSNKYFKGKVQLVQLRVSQVQKGGQVQGASLEFDL